MNTMTKGERAYQAFNYAAISVLAFLTLYPFWDVIRLSFSSASEAGRMGFSMWPREPSTEGITTTSGSDTGTPPSGS